MVLFPEAGIDGEALNELVTDFEEFSALVTAPLARIRIKKFVKTMNSANEEREANSDEVYYFSTYRYIQIITVKSRVSAQWEETLCLTFALASVCVWALSVFVVQGGVGA